MGKTIEFKIPEDWTQIFVPELINIWEFSGPLELTRKEKRDGLSGVEVIIKKPHPEGMTYSTHSTVFFLPNKSFEYGSILVETSHPRHGPNGEDMKELLGYLRQFNEEYSFYRVVMISNVGKKVSNDPPWTTRLIADREKVILEDVGWHEKDENAIQRTENYAKKLQRRGLELLSREEVLV